MKRNTFSRFASAVAGTCLLCVGASAANPYLPLWEYIPDGEPYVFEDPDNPGKFRVYIYGSHDIEKTTYCEQYEAAGVIEKNSWNILSRLVTMNVEESTQKDLLYAEIHKFANESISSFIVKGVTDESWNNYLNTLKNLRMDDYINLYQTVYDRYVEANK